MKGKATNEQLTKVLEYTLSEHQKNIEKAEKERNDFLNKLKDQIEKLESISLKPNLKEFVFLNEQLENKCRAGGQRIELALKNAYLSPLVLGIVFTVFISGVGMLTYSFNKFEKANQVGDAKELALRKYFSKFLTDNPKADKSYVIWKDKQ